jgi:anti-sigma factor RsiW
MTAAPAAECDKVLLVQAEIDGELDAAEAAALAAHRAGCPICQAAAAELVRARGLIGTAELYHAMPDELRARIAARVAVAGGGERRRRHADIARSVRLRLLSPSRWWSSAASFGLGAACAAALALLLISPRGSPGLTEQIVASHIRALQPGHLEDVASSDRHTVKPWFDGRIDFAPPVKDLAAERFPLIGGRLDYLAGRPVAALVYRRDKHLIDLFVWPQRGTEAEEEAPAASQRQGYNIVHWDWNGMTFWAVSDLEAQQLEEFAKDWQRSS